MSKIVVNTPLPIDQNYNSRLLGIYDYLACRDIVNEVIGSVGKVKGMTIFNTLVLVRRYPRLSKFQLISYSNTESIKRCIPILVNLGYVRGIGKPRLIIPFQAYKIDTGYVITASGEAILRKIIMELM